MAPRYPISANHLTFVDSLRVGRTMLACDRAAHLAAIDLPHSCPTSGKLRAIILSPPNIASLNAEVREVP
jgi:hypothetical protein